MTRQSPPDATRPPLRRLLLAVLATVMLPFTALTFTTTATADTSDFRGTNWAVLGDNFSTGQLVVDGLSGSDSYNTVYDKANALYDDMESSLGVNTVRLPVNTHTVGSSWWNNYRGAIDAATDRGFKVILAYWEDGAASGGQIVNTSAWNSMWSTIVSQYGSNSLVYFEPMNEPHGYSSSAWRNLAAGWLNDHSSVPDGRVLIGGTGYSYDLRDLCSDSRFSNTLFSFHHYAFFFGDNDYDGWRNSVETRLGNCADRAVFTEFGAPQNNGLNYGDPDSSNNFVRHIRAVTDVMRENDMGGTYWPAVGGKPGDIGYDWYSIYEMTGSGTNLNLDVRNPSGANRLLWAWGDDVDPNYDETGSGGGVSAVVNVSSGKCVDVVSASTDNGAEIIQWDCHGGTNQQWDFNDLGNGYYEIVSQNSGRCLDVDGGSTANNAQIIQWDCHGGTNQQWQVTDVGGGQVEISARHSDKCLDVPDDNNSTRLQQYDCWGGDNQRWTLD